MHSQDELAFLLAWGLSTGPTRGPKPQFTIGAVAQAGMAVADELGLGGLSLARVAQRLGLTTTALYRYVPSKEILLELIADGAAGRPPALKGVTWEERVREWVNARASQVRLHPWLAEVRPTGLPRLPNSVSWIEALLLAVKDQPAIDGMRLALLLDTIVITYTRNALAGAETASVPDWFTTTLQERAPQLYGALEHQQTTDELSQAVEIVLQGLTHD